MVWYQQRFLLKCDRSGQCFLCAVRVRSACLINSVGMLGRLDVTSEMIVNVSCVESCSARAECGLELETKVHPKVRNHGEGRYLGLLLVESGYYRFHI